MLQYEANIELTIRVNNSVFTIPKGYKVYSTQHDNNKVLLPFGKGSIDWFDKAFLKNFTAIGLCSSCKDSQCAGCLEVKS